MRDDFRRACRGGPQFAAGAGQKLRSGARRGGACSTIDKGLRHLPSRASRGEVQPDGDGQRSARRAISSDTTAFRRGPSGFRHLAVRAADADRVQSCVAPGKHFAEKKQAFDCRTCHVRMRRSASSNWPVRSGVCVVPRREDRARAWAAACRCSRCRRWTWTALAKAGHDIGPGRGGDGRFRRPIAAADEAAAWRPIRPRREAIDTLGADFEFQDVDPDDPQQLAGGADWRWRSRRCCADVSKRGPAAVRERLSAVLGRQVTAAGCGRAGCRPVGRYDATVRRGLAAGRRCGSVNGTGGIPASAQAVERLTTADSRNSSRTIRGGFWMRDDATFSIRYRRRRHADPVLTAWLDDLAATPQWNRGRLPLRCSRNYRRRRRPGCVHRATASSNRSTVNWHQLASIRSRDRAARVHEVLARAASGVAAVGGLHELPCHRCGARTRPPRTRTWNPHRFVSEFKPMSKRQCAECHTHGGRR